MNGIERIAAERRRQIDEEGWTSEHDDQHRDAEMSYVAACYARTAMFQARDDKDGLPPLPVERYHDLAFEGGNWPRTWHTYWWNPSSDPIRNLEKAGALIAAEIDRLLRLQEQSG